MQNYLKIDVPLLKNARWFDALKRTLNGYPVKWQNGGYHITMAFINENPNHINLIPVFEKHLSSAVAPVLLFDKIDAFTANISSNHIINLTTTTIPDSFLSLVESIRYDLKEVGCILESDFKLHVTLGRQDISIVDINTLSSLVKQVQITPFSLTLTDAHFCILGSKRDPLFSIKLRTTDL